MNKQELVASISSKSGLSKADAERALNAFTESVKETLIAGDKVQLIGFGTFDTRANKARQGVNPRDPQGPKIDIPASVTATFKQGKALKDAIQK